MVCCSETRTEAKAQHAGHTSAQATCEFKAGKHATIAQRQQWASAERDRSANRGAVERRERQLDDGVSIVMGGDASESPTLWHAHVGGYRNSRYAARGTRQCAHRRARTGIVARHRTRLWGLRRSVCSMSPVSIVVDHRSMIMRDG